MNAETLGKKGLRQEETLFSIVSQEKKTNPPRWPAAAVYFFCFLVKPFEYISGNKALTLRLGVSHSFKLSHIWEPALKEMASSTTYTAL